MLLKELTAINDTDVNGNTEFAGLSSILADSVALNYPKTAPQNRVPFTELLTKDGREIYSTNYIDNILGGRAIDDYETKEGEQVPGFITALKELDASIPRRSPNKQNPTPPKVCKAPQFYTYVFKRSPKKKA